MLDRLLDERAKHLHVDVRDALDVEARLPRLVLAERRHQLRVTLEAWHDVQRQILLSRGEPGQEPIELAPALVPVPVIAEPDDARAPHLRFRSRRFLHDLNDGETILTTRLVVDGIEEIANARSRWFRLELGHGGLRRGRRAHRCYDSRNRKLNRRKW